MSDASVSSKSVLSRSIQLLLDVERVLDSEPSKLQIVLDVLREELTIESLLDEIQREYGESYDHDELMVFGHVSCFVITQVVAVTQCMIGQYNIIPNS